MLTKNNLIYVFLSLGLIWAGFYLANIPVERMISYAVLLMLSGVSIGLMLVAYPLETHIKVIRSCLKGVASMPSESGEFIAYFRALAKIGMVSGLLGFMLGFALLFENFNTPGELGAPLAIGIKSLGYGVMVRMMALGFADRLHDRVESGASTVRESGVMDASKLENTSRAA